MISIVKLVSGELSLDLIGDCDEKSRNVVPEKIDKLIVSHDDQYIRFCLFHIGAKYSKSIFGILSQLFLLFQRRPSGGTLRCHAVMEIHKVFPLGSRFEKNVRSMARRQRGD